MLLVLFIIKCKLHVVQVTWSVHVPVGVPGSLPDPVVPHVSELLSCSVVEALPFSCHVNSIWNAFSCGLGHWVLFSWMHFIMSMSTPSWTPIDTQHEVIPLARSWWCSCKESWSMSCYWYFSSLLSFGALGIYMECVGAVFNKMYPLFCLLGTAAEVLSLLGNYHNPSRFSSHYSVYLKW